MGTEPLATDLEAPGPLRYHVTQMGERLGQQLGAYVVSGHLADGSTGSIYEARRGESGERVAIKILHEAVRRDPVAVERFRREYETAKSLEHPYVLDVLDFGEASDGAPFMVMKLVDGEELGTLLRRDGPLSPPRTARLVSQIALALHDAHAEGVIHRDLKPANVLVCKPGDREEIRVLDFGSVKLQVEQGPKLTALGTTLGSPYYMSPEQAAGEPDLDARTDVFALAAIAHELATGAVAFDGEAVGEILAKIVGEDPVPVSSLSPSYPWAFDDAIKKGLRKERSERYDDAVELAEALLSSLGLEPDVEQTAAAPLHELEARFESTSDEGAEPPASAWRQASSIPVGLPRRDRRLATVLTVLAFGAALFTGAWWLGS